MRRLLVFTLLAVAVNSPIACRENSGSNTHSLRDFSGREVTVPLRPSRIISLLPSTTELLFAAGAGDLVVGVSNFSDYPPEAKKRTRIGGLELNFELLNALHPDLVVSACALTKGSVQALSARGLPVFCVDPNSFSEIAGALRVLGAMTGHADEGEIAATDLERRVRNVELRVLGKPRPSVVLELTSEIHLAVPGTYADDVIRRAGGQNAFRELSGHIFAPISWEAVLARDPEFYVVAHTEPPRPEQRPGFDRLRAAREHHALSIDPNWILYPTPRLVLGLEWLAGVLHP